MAITDNNVKWRVTKVASYGASVDMKGATATEDGEAGLVPAPVAGKQASFLRGDGTWQSVPTPTLTSLGVTATAAELNYVDGVTSNIQTQLNGKLSTSGKAASATTADSATTAGNVTGIVAIANGGTGGEKFIKDASISGKVITLTYSDNTTETLTIQDTAKQFYGPTKLDSGNFTATCDGFLIAVDTGNSNGRNIKIYNNSVLMASHYDHHASQAFGIAPFKAGDVMTASGTVNYYKMELR